VRSGDVSAIRCDLPEAMKTQRAVDAIAAVLARSTHRSIGGLPGRAGGDVDAVEYS
jgi:hypothetical protein